MVEGSACLLYAYFSFGQGVGESVMVVGHQSCRGVLEVGSLVQRFKVWALVAGEAQEVRRLDG